jgi:hypothetical protein
VPDLPIGRQLRLFRRKKNRKNIENIERSNNALQPISYNAVKGAYEKIWKQCISVACKLNGRSIRPLKI